MKRFITLMMIGIMAFSMVACGSDKGAEDTSVSTEETSQEASE